MWSWSYPFQGWFVINSLVLSMINLTTKFELSNYTHYKDRKGDTKYVQLCRPSNRRAKTYPGCGLGFPAITSTLATHWFFPDGTIYQTRLMLYGFHYGPASIKWCVYGSLKIASRDTAHEFPLAFHCSYIHHFWDIANLHLLQMLAENRQFNILHLHFMPSMGLPHSNFIKIFATSN